MKQKLLHLLAVFVAIFATIPIANAAQITYSFNSTPRWEWVGTLNGAKNIAVSNGSLYISSPVNYSTITYVNENISFNDLKNFDSGLTVAKFGYAMDNDDAGNIVIGTNENDYYSAYTKFVVYYNNAKVKEIAIPTDLQYTGRCDFIRVQGNVLEGSGYIWILPQSTQKILRFNVVDGNIESCTTWTYTTPGEVQAISLAYMLEDGRIYLHSRGNGLYLFTVPEDGGAVTSYTTITGPTTSSKNNLTSELITLQGSQFHIISSGDANGDISFNVVNNTTGQTLASNININGGTATDGTTTQASGISGVGTVVRAIKVDACNYDIYCYAPKHGAACYRLTANVTTETVSNVSATANDEKTEATVTWTKPATDVPTNYSISYSSDGGTTWSTPVVTTDLSYTFTDLESGIYKFKVTPYFEQYLTYGADVTSSNDVEIFTGKGAPINNLQYSYTKAAVGRQDITLSWFAPAAADLVNTTVTGYKVYRGTTLLATLGADETTYTHSGVTTNYTYTVVPLFSGLSEDSSLGRSVTPTEVVTGVFVAPEITEIRNYNGYSLTEVFYKMPSYKPYVPLYYNLYRDGALIQSKLQSFNTLDETIIQNTKDTTYVKYQIEAVYGTVLDKAAPIDSTTYPPVDSVKSEITTVKIHPRDIAKTRYILQEVYNVPIDEIAEDKKPNLFDNTEYYRQGQFRNGYWYIAQRADNLSLKAKELAAGATSSVAADDKSGVEGSTGGVVKFKATTEGDILAGLVEKPVTTAEFSNVGIAMDNVGTIFVRSNNNDKLKATVPTGHGTESAWGWIEDSFMRRITEGTFYKLNADSVTYTEVATKLDLTKLWTDNRWIDEMTYTGVVGQGQVHGRSDYYHMYGDVLGVGGYLIISPSWTRTAFKVYIKGGVYQSHEVLEFNKYQNQSYVLTPSTGSENYGFKLAGRDEVTLQIRSNGYYGVHDWATDDWHPIFTAESRVNNAGGASTEAFGTKVTQEMIDAEGSVYEQADLDKNTGELFIVTPQSMHSHNVGDFLVSRATKSNASDLASEGTLMPSAPVAMKVQTDQRSNSTATNANGNWFHAEAGTYSGSNSDEDPCVDIYQYVPGTRFARYRLIPSEQFPPVQPSLVITTAYNADTTDITHFNGVATWKRPAGFGRSGSSEANAKVESYLFELLNSKNEVVVKTEVAEIYDADGEPVSDDHVYEFDYTAFTDSTDIDSTRYTVSVQVKYKTKDNAYHYSEKAYAEHIHDYIAQPATKQSVDVFVRRNNVLSYWVQDANGEWVVETKTVDSYRADLDFSAPVWDNDEDKEPVSYYTIKAAVKVNVTDPVTGAVTQKADTIEIKDFLLHQGSEIKDGKIWAKTTKTSQIPGTYNFAEGGDKAPYFTTYDAESGAGLYKPAEDGGSYKNVVLSWFYDKPVVAASEPTTMSLDLDENTEIANTPDEWQFFIVAHYAARNTVIDKDATVSAMTEQLTPTGLEVVGDDNVSSLSIYPIPASTSITIKSGEAINSIVIYNEAGAEVMNLNGDGDTITEVNIENLATGYYFVKVNNQALVKIIKK